ncbi:putative cell wall binding repeat protein [Prauserella shujinwangii]|uniref:Putative cell wall binding repeat protein n=1 Tax=Prauserella shujinwangii TaxID=1453103 RepID=A0A2T0LXA8_9PSEU|nr:cell wall-binding repeat-containing protein [Prauserella shujinwangii]PRX48663.1 putative cell wall binding repeat protein [Prauserella shujinwangii]
MHVTLKRRVHTRSARSFGAVVLAAATVLGGLAGGTAAADQADQTDRAELSKAQRVDAAPGIHAHATRVNAQKPDQRTMAAGPEGCITTKSSAEGDVLRFRYAGQNRYTTAVCTSYGTWWDHDEPGEELLKADAVVLARGDNFPDALAGGPLAAYVNGPLLLNSPDRLLPEVKAEIQRVLAPGGKVFLLGGTGSLSAGVRSAITAMGYQTERIAGANRFETAIRIAERMPTTNLFFVTTGMNFPDALAAGEYAAQYTYYATHAPDLTDRRPIALLFTNDGRMPATTAQFADARASEHDRSLLMMTAGGAADRAVRATFPPAVIESFVGANRFETAAVIARRLYTDPSSGELLAWGAGLANGMNFPDALGGTGLLMTYGDPLLLTRATTLDAPTRQFLQNHQRPSSPDDPAFLHVFGGTAVVSAGVADAALNAFD